jgi:superfamily II RNA helicase
VTPEPEQPPASRGVHADLPPLETLFPFPLDEFQQQAIKSIEQGRNVVVCAPTGAGKTVVAEYASYRALAAGYRCFYTTPLKALSNQKFFDFRASLGPAKVGLLTGDTSIQRDASLVVMTTEVFRNMLYGTTLGEVSRNLRGVRFVVLDECHFMNDVERGTVWEESVIYAPREVQLIALSATIENAEELRDWMTEVHGPTDLWVTSYRPVPLHFWYWIDDQLNRLVNKDGSMNPALRHKTQSARAATRGARLRGDRRRREPQPERPRSSDVCKALDKRSMLPAIYFVFSRKGCEESLQHANKTVHLSAAEEQELHDAIEEALESNPALRSHPHLPYLYSGVAAHHAGLLPSWKSLVERLFNRGLVKVVFATETLAAGINMPARTTVISAISKRSDEGHRTLTASEFLQMSGRAGRRGMDKVGNVVVLSHPRETVEEAARLARARPDPLVSQFTPSYGMVLNLLQRHSMEECRGLLEQSFGQFLAQRTAGGMRSDLEAVEREIERLRGDLCPDEIGDLARYRDLYEQMRAARKQAKALEHGKGKKEDPVVAAEARRLHDEQKRLLDEARRMPCHGCPEIEPCGRKDEDIRRLQNRRSEMQRRMRRVSTPYWSQFKNLVAVLQEGDYLDGSVPTVAGRMAAALRATNVFFIAEVARSGMLDPLHPHDAAAVLTAIVTEETRRAEFLGVTPSEEATAALREVVQLARTVDHLQRGHDVDIPVIVNPVYSGLAQLWAHEEVEWETMRGHIGFDEGDLIRCLRRTVDIARQIAHAPEVPQVTAGVCRAVENLLSRDEVRDEFLAQQLPAEAREALEQSEPLDMHEILEELLEEDELID